MAAQDDFDEMIEQYHRALEAFFSGDPEPVIEMYSHKDDASLANPFGPVVIGFEQVAPTIRQAVKHYREGKNTGFERSVAYGTPDLQYIVEVERTTAKMGEREEESDVALRVTSVFRREDGTWKVCHRHADPITSARPPESVIGG